MSPTTQELHAPIAFQEKIPLLVVSPQAEDYSVVRRIFQNAQWEVNHAANLYQAGKLLQQTHASVIVCERDLPDGTWKDLLPQTLELPTVPSLLVVSRHANDDLWAEVLTCGGYDVLPKPFDNAELVRAVEMALHHCQSHQPVKHAAAAG